MDAGRCGVDDDRRTGDVAAASAVGGWVRASGEWWSCVDPSKRVRRAERGALKGKERGQCAVEQAAVRQRRACRGGCSHLWPNRGRGLTRQGGRWHRRGGRVIPRPRRCFRLSGGRRAVEEEWVDEGGEREVRSNKDLSGGGTSLFALADEQQKGSVSG